MSERADSILRKCNLLRSMLVFLEKSIETGDVIQAATVVKTITETAGDIAYESGRYNEALLQPATKPTTARVRG